MFNNKTKLLSQNEIVSWNLILPDVYWHVKNHNAETAVDTSNSYKFFIQFFILMLVTIDAR